MADQKDPEETLSYLIEHGSTEAIRDFLRSKEAKEKRARLHAVAQKFHKEANIHRVVRDGNTFMAITSYPVDVAERAFVAVAITSTAEQFKNTKWGFRDAFELDLDLARQLPPECLTACVESLLEHNPRAYRRVREIVTAGLCPRPTTEQYAIGLIAFKAHHEHRDITLEALRKSPEILSEDIWLLFETEGTGDISLAAIDKYSSPGSTWSDILYILQKEGEIPRDRLLKASLEALNRGFIQFRAGWFSRFHETLKPTPAERLLLMEDYGRLLSSNIQPTVSFALAAWLEIDKHQPLPPDLVIRYLPPCLSAQTKSTVINALSLLEKTAKRDEQFRLTALKEALEAMVHESSEVQGKVLKFLTEQKELIDDEIRSKIGKNIETLSPSLQEGFRKLAGAQGAPQAEPLERYEMAPNAWDIFSLGEPIRVISDPEDFINFNLLLLEMPFIPANVESILTAVAMGKVEVLRNIHKSKGDSTPAKAVKPLIARLKKLVKLKTDYQKDSFYFFNLFILLFLGVEYEPDESSKLKKNFYEQLTEAALESGGTHRLIRHFANKLVGILNRSARGQFGLLGSPTYDSGYISPEDFLQQERFAAETDCHLTEIDANSAVVRLPWSTHEAVFASLNASRATGRFASTCKKILSELIETRKLFETQDPYTKDLLTIKALEESTNYTLAAMAKIPSVTSNDSSILALSIYDYPIFSEQFHAEGAKECKRAIKWFDVSDLSRQGYFLALARGITPLRERAHFLLGVGCLLSIPEIVTLVSDCLISSIEERKLNVGLLGEKLSLLLHSEISMPKRAANILGRTAQISSLHNDAVRQIIEHCLARDPKDSEVGIPRDIGALLEVLANCSILARQPITNQLTRSYLSSIKPGSKSGKLAKELLALS